MRGVNSQVHMFYSQEECLSTSTIVILDYLLLLIFAATANIQKAVGLFQILLSAKDNYFRCGPT